VEQYRKRRMALEELYQHDKHDKRLSNSEGEMLRKKHRAKIGRLISKTEDRLRKIAADRKEKAGLEAEKKAKEREMEKRAKEQEETRRILAKADDASFLKESNYPPGMLADPGIKKVLKAYKITLENQRKKVADYARRRDETQEGHLVINWGRETIKAQEELVRMLERYEKDLGRLKIAWEAAAARKQKAEAPQPPDPSKLEK